MLKHLNAYNTPFFRVEFFEIQNALLQIFKTNTRHIIFNKTMLFKPLKQNWAVDAMKIIFTFFIFVICLLDSSY